MRFTWLALFCLLPRPLPAQTPTPVGTLLPAQLDTGLNARKLHADHMVRARIIQNIPGTPIRRGAQIVVHVASATPNQIEIPFDAASAGS